ncbi:hypothetical protein C8R45DRAFT_939545 [Mycena sanguinolenta]|nr:hypothetical protein C8R45DRAFT_939545 [Mycena sanguinolenta]
MLPPCRWRKSAVNHNLRTARKSRSWTTYIDAMTASTSPLGGVWRQESLVTVNLWPTGSESDFKVNLGSYCALRATSNSIFARVGEALHRCAFSHVTRKPLLIDLAPSSPATFIQSDLAQTLGNARFLSVHGQGNEFTKGHKFIFVTYSIRTSREGRVGNESDPYSQDQKIVGNIKDKAGIRRYGVIREIQADQPAARPERQREISKPREDRFQRPLTPPMCCLGEQDRLVPETAHWREMGKIQCGREPTWIVIQSKYEGLYPRSSRAPFAFNVSVRVKYFRSNTLLESESVAVTAAAVAARHLTPQMPKFPASESGF